MYIVENDIKVLLPQRDIDIILEKAEGEDSEAFLTQRVSFAIDFVQSKIQHRFDPAQIFIDVITTFSLSTAYEIGDLLLYNESAYVAGTAYVIDDRVSYNDYIYTCIQNSTGNLPTDASYWTQVVHSNRFFNCTADSTGNYPEDTDYFAEGDSRDQLIFTYTLYIAVYELFKKVQPTMVPDWLISSRDEAVEHLNRIARGLDTVLLPLYEVDQGQEITYDFPIADQNYDF